jgi:hypothetical protein
MLQIEARQALRLVTPRMAWRLFPKRLIAALVDAGRKTLAPNLAAASLRIAPAPRSRSSSCFRRGGRSGPR